MSPRVDAANEGFILLMMLSTLHMLNALENMYFSYFCQILFVKLLSCSSNFKFQHDLTSVPVCS